MKCEKLGISVAFLSALAFFFGYYDFTIAAIITVGVICASQNEKLRKNVLNAFIFSLLLTIITYILGKISYGYIKTLGTMLTWEWLSKVYTYKVYEVLSKLDICAILVKIINIVEFILMIVFIVLSLLGKTVKIPGVAAIVDKVLDIKAEEKKEEEENPVTSEVETLTEIPR